MVATITQDYFETETGVEQLIVSTYDALRVTKQYQQGPFAFFTGVDNMMLNLPIMLFIQDQFGLLLVMKQRMLMDYVVSILVINCWVFILVLIIVSCNSSIREGKVDGKFASDQAYAEQRMAEAMFNRSYCIYLMNTLLGDVYVPRGYTTALPENYAYNRETSESLYKLMIGDLRYAFEKLSKASEQSGADYGRATKGAAAHFWQSFICNVHKG